MTDGMMSGGDSRLDAPRPEHEIDPEAPAKALATVDGMDDEAIRRAFPAKIPGKAGT